MRRSRAIRLLVPLVLVAMVSGVYVLFPRAREYWWISKLESDYSIAHPAAEALLRNGGRYGVQRATEYMMLVNRDGFLRWLQDSASNFGPRRIEGVKDAFREVLVKVHPSSKLAFESLWWLRGTTPIDRHLVEIISQRLSRRGFEDVPTWRLVLALGMCDEQRVEEVPVLSRALKHADWRVRWAAVRSLGFRAWQKPDSVPLLAQALSDSEPKVVAEAANALFYVENIDAAIPFLKAASNHKEKMAAEAVARALGRAAPLDEELALTLVKRPSPYSPQRLPGSWSSLLNAPPPSPPILGEPDELTREALHSFHASLRAALRLHSNPGRLVAKYTTLYPQAVGDEEQALALELGALGAFAASAAPLVIHSLDRESIEFRSSRSRRRSFFLNALRAMGPSVLPHLLKGLEDADVGRLSGILVVMGLLPTEAEACIPVLRKYLRHDHDVVSGEAAVSLVRLGAAREALPTIEALLQINPRGFAVWPTLHVHGPVAPLLPELDVLREMLKSPNPSVAMWAANHIGEIGPDAIAALPDLLERLASESDSSLTHRVLRCVTAVAPNSMEAAAAIARVVQRTPGSSFLSGIGPYVGRMGSLLTKLAPMYLSVVASKNGDPRYAWSALLRIAPDHPQVLATLEQVLKADPRSYVRPHVLRQLAAVEGLPATFLPVVKSYANSKDRQTAELATLAWWRLSKNVDEVLPAFRERLSAAVRVVPVRVGFLALGGEIRCFDRVCYTDGLRSIVAATGEMGEDARDLVPLLRKLRDYPDDALQGEVLKSLWRIEADFDLDRMRREIRYPDDSLRAVLEIVKEAGQRASLLESDLKRCAGFGLESSRELARDALSGLVSGN
ncbi:MAG: HEAT repeat domain-containing protein [Planctomycetota bacterium]